MATKEIKRIFIKPAKDQTLAEEIANALTHGVGVGLSITALVLLTIIAAVKHNDYKIVSSVLYASTLTLMYLMSTLYHSIRHPRAKHFLKILDHSSIYLLIAGTYTPFTLVTLHGAWGWSLFGIIWGLAICGVIFKLFFVHRFEILSTLIYIAMGWLVLIAIKPIIDHLPPWGLFWLVIGGVCYTSGVIFYAWERLRFSHTIWHLFVLAGSICHFFSIYYYVI